VALLGAGVVEGIAAGVSGAVWVSGFFSSARHAHSARASANSEPWLARASPAGKELKARLGFRVIVVSPARPTPK
jgi:hypothetical protein